MTEILQPLEVARAAKLLREGRLVAFPTETVYGLGADARNAEAVAAIFEAKGRPHFNPLILHFGSIRFAFREVVPDERAERLARKFWPGPLTLVLPRHPDSRVDLLAGAGLDTLAIRVPGHRLALAMLNLTMIPIAAPSANPSGGVSPTTAAHVRDGLDNVVDAILDGGPCAVGVESTVLDLSGGGAVLLRPGGVPVEEIEAEIGPVGRPVPIEAGEATRSLRSPGMLLSHYAPDSPVRVGATEVGEDEALLAFGDPLPGAAVTWNLSPRANVGEAAARLFSGLRWLDLRVSRLGLKGIAAMPVPGGGLGAAINDRLQRAAAPRPRPLV
ncbi:L-threonylcarbamoyladenylate synthase [Roseomonas sp. CCTCC AB2023176]|uniref:L-threonylcarbamoyladenylate synthase n=1 Tax=Roseomonas sp. CCTCC AB2023176 TaxID=3342640 RepID=UPI0035DA37AD